jgi:hypothetical protein
MVSLNRRIILAFKTNFMQKAIITLTSLFICSLLWAQDDTPVSVWATTPVKADGKPEEWHLPLRFYDNNTKLLYAIANDSKNLYLCFQTSDEINQQKIMRAGMKVTLISKAGDKRKVSINFPLAQPHMLVKPEAGADSTEKHTERKDLKNNFLVQNTLMEVKGFATKNGAIEINDSSGINVAINWDDANQLTYEIVIPFAEFYGKQFSIEDLSKYITMEVEVNAVPKQEHSGGGGRGGEGRMGGGGMGRGGGMGGRGGGMGRQRSNMGGDEAGGGNSFGSRAAMFEKSELKQKFTLSIATTKSR